MWELATGDVENSLLRSYSLRYYFLFPFFQLVSLECPLSQVHERKNIFPMKCLVLYLHFYKLFVYFRFNSYFLLCIFATAPINLTCNEVFSLGPTAAYDPI